MFGTYNMSDLRSAANSVWLAVGVEDDGFISLTAGNDDWYFDSIDSAMDFVKNYKG